MLFPLRIELRMGMKKELFLISEAVLFDSFGILIIV